MSGNKEKRRSRKSLQDCKAEFRVRRTVSEPELENQDPLASKEEIFAKKYVEPFEAKKAKIAEKTAQWTSIQAIPQLQLPEITSNDFNGWDPSPFENSLAASKMAIENHLFKERSKILIEQENENYQKFIAEHELLGRKHAATSVPE
ncbi:Oidioi.mRNA.OKI2018_I69.XSR.g16473.t1.cds [Oikopleura dioica]|uniref:Oidioi.mRNA.OKI2018_I69.XSR.g16473.t1.cds n=1 Tax=Oikopleura dioica TaxID=34765 RepID=A0ABN7SI23_OIKDI|nr:Oidioi.mRNA.OKI2018_I69.XSR.g16473.t1.cds [Oikopleura dioica]